jgi:hypothetical protein
MLRKNEKKTQKTNKQKQYLNVMKITCDLSYEGKSIISGA